MQGNNRRDFIKRVAVGGAAGYWAASKPVFSSGAPLGANDAVRVAIIGLRSKGHHHIQMYKDVPGVRIVALCDADENILDKEIKELATGNIKVERYVDIRRLLENKDIDAVSIATPNHWHSLMAVWACQAGKDVYVEKPISHNVWEGRRAVEAARKYGRIVQAGTQSRSDTALQEVAAYLHSGELGKILRARGFCYKRRASIGKVAGPQPIPSGVNYDLWCGPAPLEPLARKGLHYDWHWVWPTGNGDIGNQGIHEMDMCRWMLGEKQLPPRVFSVGGRFGYDDDGQTPNTQIAVLDYPAAPLIFEVRGLPEKAGMENMGHYRGVRIGVVVDCENGSFVGGAGGGWIYDRDNKRVKQFSSSGGDDHVPNFIRAVRSRNNSELKADILEGHISSALCHLGNISHRLGTEFPQAEIQEKVKDRADVCEALSRFSEHLSANGVDMTQARPALGALLEFAPAEEKFVSGCEYDLGSWANQLVTRRYREPYVVPEKV
ncbi:MAG: gfo/Idh/MocA family oxidoreductase [Acidobacteria bacterium]|nr:MAG: gfo/Idh/MocA family oxidoreductase [Acidobacteriota bacterium]